MAQAAPQWLRAQRSWPSSPAPYSEGAGPAHGLRTQRSWPSPAHYPKGAGPTPRAARAALLAVRPRPTPLSRRPSPVPYLEGFWRRPRGPRAHGQVLQAARDVHLLRGGFGLLPRSCHPAELPSPAPERLPADEPERRGGCREPWSRGPAGSREARAPYPRTGGLCARLLPRPSAFLPFLVGLVLYFEPNAQQTVQSLVQYGQSLGDTTRSA